MWPERAEHQVILLHNTYMHVLSDVSCLFAVARCKQSILNKERGKKIIHKVLNVFIKHSDVENLLNTLVDYNLLQTVLKVLCWHIFAL